MTTPEAVAELIKEVRPDLKVVDVSRIYPEREQYFDEKSLADFQLLLLTGGTRFIFRGTRMQASKGWTVEKLTEMFSSMPEHLKSEERVDCVVCLDSPSKNNVCRRCLHGFCESCFKEYVHREAFNDIVLQDSRIFATRHICPVCKLKNVNAYGDLESLPQHVKKEVLLRCMLTCDD